MEGDEEQIVSLLNKAFEGWHNMQHWEWKYKVIKDVFGCPPIIWIAEDHNNIVGHYAAIPAKMKLEKKSVLTFQGVDAATHPSYRRRGIYEGLVKRVSEDAGKEAAFATFAFPTSGGASYECFVRKLGWSDVHPVTIMFKILNLKGVFSKGRFTFTAKHDFYPHVKNVKMNKTKIFDIRVLLQLFKRLFLALSSAYIAKDQFHPSFKNIKINKTRILDERYDEFWKKTSRKYDVAIERSRQYLNWRYFNNPDANYTVYLAEKENEVLGYIVTKCTTIGLDVGPLKVTNLKMGHIVDLLGEEMILACLIAVAEEDFKKEKIDLIHCWTMEDHPEYELFKKMGFFSLPKSIGEFAFVSKILLPDETWTTETFFEKHKNLLLSLGDSDNE